MIGHDEASHESDDSDVDVAFASMDFSGVDFGGDYGGNETKSDLLQWEERLALGQFPKEEEVPDLTAQALVQHVRHGRFVEVMKSETAQLFFDNIQCSSGPGTATQKIHERVLTMGTDVLRCAHLEILAIAAFNLFLQANYTGPSIEASALVGIHPHSCFSALLSSDDDSKGEEHKLDVTKSHRDTAYHNAILSELAVAGQWPVQVCEVPYFFLLSRIIFSALCYSPDHQHWHVSDEELQAPTAEFIACSKNLRGCWLWNGRATVAHERLLQTREPSVCLWNEAKQSFEKAADAFSRGGFSKTEGAGVWLELGLAHHHFDRPGKGLSCFQKAQEMSGLFVEVTGAVGKRTKFQVEGKAQMLVRAESSAHPATPQRTKEDVRQQLVRHTEEGILLENIAFDEAENTLPLTVLDQTILLALCLDVKNSNPVDGLTSEEMGAYLARALEHHDDWMVYATGLLERSWLEFERTHAKERAILQIQALVDQHTNRLTITQSTRQSIEESAPVQDRLTHLHHIVYPPRWELMCDLADRYAEMGAVSSAAELFVDVEYWSDAVDCFRAAGKTLHAEKIVRERLLLKETARMLEALGDITKDPVYYERAIEVSGGRYSSAFIALATHFYDNKNLEKAVENYEEALKTRPLNPSAWFRLGTICMQLERWDRALSCFTEVVQQEPEEADAWANVAAIHMRNRQPSQAYPALVESLKHSRRNWRVWISKLHTCLDLQKYDEAIQCCSMLLDFRASDASRVPQVEERCVRAVVGGVLTGYRESNGSEPSRRSLNRVQELLQRLSNLSDAEPWVFEVVAFVNQATGQQQALIENLQKQYRVIQAVPGWESNDASVAKIYDVVSHLVNIHVAAEPVVKEDIVKSRFLLRNLVKTLERAHPESPPKEVQDLYGLLELLNLHVKR